MIMWHVGAVAWWLGMLSLMLTPVEAQEHQHPAADADLHARFYAGWMIPNGGEPRRSSCCSLKDCYPTEIRQQAGVYLARRREDGAWIPIPRGKLEHEQGDPRESPDGQSHVCMPPPGAGTVVYCAVLGSGI
jgi:hypothetical protein